MRGFSRSGRLLAAMLAFAGPVLAQAPEDPRLRQIDEALQRKDYAAAKPLLAAVSDTGNVQAAMILAELASKGLGEPKNTAEAMRWLTLAAERGSEVAMMNLGDIYANGDGGIGKDEAKAIGWYDRAAAKGLLTAHTLVGSMLFNKGDHAGAAARFEKASNDPGALACRAMMMQRGQHYRQDAAVAAQLIREAFSGGTQWTLRAVPCAGSAAQAGNAEAQYQLGIRMIAGGNGFTQDAANGAGMLEKASAQGHAGASAKLGEMYWKGTGVSRDPAKAFPLNLRAADTGNKQAAFYVGEALAKGEGVTADRPRAARYFKQADWIKGAKYQYALMLADSDPEAAVSAMKAECYDNPDATNWLIQAAGRNIAAAEVAYGEVMAAGRCKVTEDRAGALAWFKRAADRNYLPGMVALGRAYLDGYGGTTDKERGIATLRRAADRGFADAQAQLGEHYLQESNFAGLRKDMAQQQQLERTGRDWMEKAVAQGHVGAMTSLAGKALLNASIQHGAMNGDYGGPQADTWARMQRNYAEALRYSRMAAAKGDENAPLQIAGLLRTQVGGRDVPGVTDLAGARRAYLDYLRAVGQDPKAFDALGQLYADGRGGPVDRVRAQFFYMAHNAKFMPTLGKMSYRATQFGKTLTPADNQAVQRMIDACQTAQWKNCF